MLTLTLLSNTDRGILGVSVAEIRGQNTFPFPWNVVHDSFNMLKTQQPPATFGFDVNGSKSEA